MSPRWDQLHRPTVDGNGPPEARGMHNLGAYGNRTGTLKYRSETRSNEPIYEGYVAQATVGD